MLAILVVGPRLAHAHPSGMPAVAWPLDPAGVGRVVDDQLEFRWADSNYLTLTGTITIDWFFTPTMPPTFQLGVTPPELTGTPIVLGVPESDRADRHVWRTATVAAGSYWIWSRVNDLPSETGSIRINAFSPGVITIAHPGDPVHPAIYVARPTSAFDFPEGEYAVPLRVFDPDGTGRVSLWAQENRDGGDTLLLLDGVPAVASSTYTWSLADVPEGDWFFRARIEDARGLSFTAYSRFLLRVQHDAFADAGLALDASADAGPRADASATPDAGFVKAGDAASRCGCRDTSGERGGVIGVSGLWLGGALLALRARRRLSAR